MNVDSIKVCTVDSPTKILRMDSKVTILISRPIRVFNFSTCHAATDVKPDQSIRRAHRYATGVKYSLSAEDGNEWNHDRNPDRFVWWAETNRVVPRFSIADLCPAINSHELIILSGSINNAHPGKRDCSWNQRSEWLTDVCLVQELSTRTPLNNVRVKFVEYRRASFYLPNISVSPGYSFEYRLTGNRGTPSAIWKFLRSSTFIPSCSAIA